MKHEAWAADAARIGVSLSPDQLSLLAEYERALLDRALPRGMIGRADADLLWRRHLLDGLRGVPVIGGAATVADLGSGAGIPGIPLAIALPETSFTLVEPRRARAALLEEVADALPLHNIEVTKRKAEQLDRRFDACLARAFSSPAGTWEAAAPLLAPGGRLVYWAGASFIEAEIAGLAGLGDVSIRFGLADSGPLVIMTRQ